MRISDTEGMMKLRSGLMAGAATVGRPTGVNGKNVFPRRAKVTAKESEYIKSKAIKGCETKSLVRAGGPGSGRRPEGGMHETATQHNFKMNLNSREGRNEYRGPQGTKLIIRPNGNWEHKFGEVKQSGTGNSSLSSHLKYFTSAQKNK